MNLISKKHICFRLQLMSTKEMNPKFHGLILNFLYCFCSSLEYFLNKIFGCKFVAIKCIPCSLQHSVLQLLKLQNSTLSVFANQSPPLQFGLLEPVPWVYYNFYYLLFLNPPPLFLSLSFSLLMHFLGLSFVGCCHNLASDGPVYILKCLL